MRSRCFVNRKRSSLPPAVASAPRFPACGKRDPVPSSARRLLYMTPAPATKLRTHERPPRAIAPGGPLFCSAVVCAVLCVHALPVFVPVPFSAPVMLFPLSPRRSLSPSFGASYDRLALRSRCILSCRLRPGLLRPVFCRLSTLVAEDQTHMAPSGYTIPLRPCAINIYIQ